MIRPRDIAKLRIVSYPDPILRSRCRPIEEFGDELAQLAEKMCALMHERKGVGLAGPQVGVPLRIFVWNPTGEPANDQVCVNPRLENSKGHLVAEEGCLSIENVTANVVRAQSTELHALRLDGSAFHLAGEDLVARIWQHEIDHLNGRLILDYMSPSEEIANRRALKELEAKYKAASPKPTKSKKRRRSVRR